MAKPAQVPETLSVLPPESAAALFATARPHRLKADQTLFTAGDPGDGCYRVEQGLLKVTVVSPSGRRAHPGDPWPRHAGRRTRDDRCAAAFGLGGGGARFRTELHQPRRFRAGRRDHPEVYRHIVKLLVRRLRDTNNVVAAMSFLSLKGRVAHALLSLAEAFGNDVGAGRILIRQKVTQSDLAAMAGIARENVSRILNDWMRQKLVSRLAGYYCLENRSALETRSGDVNHETGRPPRVCDTRSEET